MAQMALRCLERVVNDRNCEMERPWDWISTDPDLRCLKCCSSGFSDFLTEQRKKDYPTEGKSRPGSGLALGLMRRRPDLRVRSR
jgi:hypothetical protein